jgi:hypothetical protein
LFTQASSLSFNITTSEPLDMFAGRGTLQPNRNRSIRYGVGQFPDARYRLRAERREVAKFDIRSFADAAR